MDMQRLNTTEKNCTVIIAPPAETFQYHTLRSIEGPGRYGLAGLDQPFKEAVRLDTAISNRAAQLLIYCLEREVPVLSYWAFAHAVIEDYPMLDTFARAYSHPLVIKDFRPYKYIVIGNVATQFD